MKKLLLVDDSKDNLDVLSLLFEDEGFDIIALHETSTLYSTIDSFLPDLIVMDVLLGDANGLEICRRLKCGPSTKDIFIILMSASNRFNELSLEEYGADGYVSKPFDIDELASLVNSLLKPLTN